MERDRDPGGILNQCIHDGFGTLALGRSLSGPEYAHHYIKELYKRPQIELLAGTAVLSLKRNRRLLAINENGVIDMKPGAIILTMGCREKSRFQALLPGYRPAGIFTAGTVQRLVNLEGFLPGGKAVILGSGDIGMIMARRLTLEKVRVEGVFEIADRPGGLTRNVVQCLEDFGIPLHLSESITFIHGKKHIAGVTVAPVGPDRKPIKERERCIECDTLVLSVGLIPENELSREAGIKLDPKTGGPIVDQYMATSVPGIYAGGNVVQVYDLVDYVSFSAEKAGCGAAAFMLERAKSGCLYLLPGFNTAHCVPQRLSLPITEPISVYLRVKEEAEKVYIRLYHRRKVLFEKKERIVRPPEMVRLELSPQVFERIPSGSRLKISVDLS